MNALHRLVGSRLHFAWVVAAVTFVALLGSASIRVTPSVLIVPLEEAFGWSRATVASAVSVNIFLYGLMGPFAAALMMRIGVRRTAMLGLALLAAAAGLSSFMTQPWHLILTWGFMVGMGTGCMASTLAATVVNRWFVERRGLVMGILTASMATGQLIFLPLFAALAENGGWRPVIYLVAGMLALLILLVCFFLPERPSEMGLLPYGAKGPEPEAVRTGNPIVKAFAVLGRSSRSRDFWLLCASFFVCGLSTNGLIGTHLIAACIDQGIPEVHAAGLLAAMGVFDLVGTTASGWLSDRYDSRWLLFWYYLLRGLSLLFLPYTDFSLYGLSIFAVFYGLDWIATVPPTLRLTTDIFGKEEAAVVFGWVFAGHQLGGAVAATGAGLLRTETGNYLESFFIAGAACAVAALMSLMVGWKRRNPAAAAA